jgi:type IV secretory pathway VirJ component
MKWTIKINIIYLTINVLSIFAGNAQQVDQVKFPPFDNVTVYHPSKNPENIILFISGDGGWNLGVVDMAKAFVNLDVLVVGIDIVKYLKKIQNTTRECIYPAADMENLSKFVQKKYKITPYKQPVLVGYSSGATLVYALLAQAPANTFMGGISLGFCPDIEIKKPLCSGSGLKTHFLKKGVYYLDVSHIPAPLVVLQGADDKVCDFKTTATYISKIKEAEIVALPKVGHGFTHQPSWIPQMKDGYKKIKEIHNDKNLPKNLTIANSISKIDVSQFPITLTLAAKNDTLPLALLISGDGGWTSFDQNVATELALAGITVIGWDALKYFWDSKTPEKTTADMALVLEYYMQSLQKRKVILVGYSFGADVLPFIYNRLPDELKLNIETVVMMSPDETADFEIHVLDMININNLDNEYNVSKEIVKIGAKKSLAIFGSEEDSLLENQLRKINLKVQCLDGSHHYNNNTKGVAEIIVKNLNK